MGKNVIDFSEVLNFTKIGELANFHNKVTKVLEEQKVLSDPSLSGMWENIYNHFDKQAKKNHGDLILQSQRRIRKMYEDTLSTILVMTENFDFAVQQNLSRGKNS
jgi:hypothetical protein